MIYTSFTSTLEPQLNVYLIHITRIYPAAGKLLSLLCLPGFCQNIVLILPCCLPPLHLLTACTMSIICYLGLMWLLQYKLFHCTALGIGHCRSPVTCLPCPCHKILSLGKRGIEKGVR